MIGQVILKGVGLGVVLMLVLPSVSETARWAWCTCIMRTCRPGAWNWA